MAPWDALPWPHKAVVSAVLGAVLLASVTVVTCAVALAGLGQFNPEIEITRVPAWFWHFRGDPEVRRWFTLGLAVSSLLACALGAKLVAGKPRSPHGEARWASGAELRRGNLRAKAGVVLGMADGRLLRLGGEEHVLVHAPTRTGKGVGVVIPNLLTWEGAAVVLDIKGEVFRATAGWRKAQGQTIFYFDPFDPQGRTSRLNPLDHVDRVNPDRMFDALHEVAGLLFPDPERGEVFWNQAARNAFLGVALLVAQTPEARLTLGEITRRLMGRTVRDTLPAAIKSLEAKGVNVDRRCQLLVDDFCGGAETTFASIRQTITARLGLWLSPAIDNATAASDFKLADVRISPMTLYLATAPADLARIYPLYSLLLHLLIKHLTKVHPAPGDPRKVLLMLDEFAQLPRSDFMAKAFSYVAGYGVRIVCVLQSPAQLVDDYGRARADDIRANCGAEVVFAPKLLSVAREISDILGTAASKRRTYSRPAGLERGRRSISENEQPRPLLLAHELLQLSTDRLIILRTGMRPVQGRKLRYFDSRWLARRVMPPPIIGSMPADSSPEATASEPDGEMQIQSWEAQELQRSYGEFLGRRGATDA